MKRKLLIFTLLLICLNFLLIFHSNFNNSLNINKMDTNSATNTNGLNTITIGTSNYATYFTTDSNIEIVSGKFQLKSDVQTMDLKNPSVTYFGTNTRDRGGDWSTISNEPAGNNYASCYTGNLNIHCGYVATFSNSESDIRKTPYKYSNFNSKTFESYVTQSGQKAAGSGADYSLYNYQTLNYNQIYAIGNVLSFSPVDDINNYFHRTNTIGINQFKTTWDTTNSEYDIELKFRGRSIPEAGDYFESLFVHATTKATLSWNTMRDSTTLSPKTATTSIPIGPVGFPKKITKITLHNLLVPIVGIEYTTSYTLQYKKYFDNAWSSSWITISSGQTLNQYAEKIQIRIILSTDNYWYYTPKFESVKIEYDDTPAVTPILSLPQRTPAVISQIDPVSVSIQSNSPYWPILSADLYYTSNSWATSSTISLSGSYEYGIDRYSAIIPIHPSGTLVEYYFHIVNHDSDGSTGIAQSSIFSYSVSSSPELYEGTVTPSFGEALTQVFIYSVNYTDKDNDAPAIIDVTIDGSTYGMTKETPSDTDYTDGVIYKYSTTLGIGVHTYYFDAESVNVAQDPVRLPKFGVFSGPVTTGIIGDIHISPNRKQNPTDPDAVECTDAVDVYFNVSTSYSLTSAVVEWSINDFVDTQTITAINIGGQDYRTQLKIPAQVYDTTVKYKIILENGDTIIYPDEYIIDDFTSPIISNIEQNPPIDSVGESTPVNITLQVIEPNCASGVLTVQLKYNITIGGFITEEQTIGMSTTDLEYFTALIPATPKGATVSYQIIAYDNAGNTETSQVFTYTITDIGFFVDIPVMLLYGFIIGGGLGIWAFGEYSYKNGTIKKGTRNLLRYLGIGIIPLGLAIMIGLGLAPFNLSGLSIGDFLGDIGKSGPFYTALFIIIPIVMVIGIVAFYYALKGRSPTNNRIRYRF
jgi:hypothetical protein